MTINTSHQRYNFKRAAIDDSARTMDFVISTADEDRDGDVIEPTGWDLNNYLKNPVVLWGHNGYSIPPIGKAVSVSVRPDGLYARAEFATKEAHPLADTVYQLLKSDVLSAVSVGFMIKKSEPRPDGKRGMLIKQAELLEFSVVSVPSNPNALAIARSKGVELYPLRDGILNELDAAEAAEEKSHLAACYLEASKGAGNKRAVYDAAGVYVGTVNGGVLAISKTYQDRLAARNLDAIGGNPSGTSPTYNARLRLADAKARAIRVRTA